MLIFYELKLLTVKKEPERELGLSESKSMDKFQRVNHCIFLGA